MDQLTKNDTVNLLHIYVTTSYFSLQFQKHIEFMIFIHWIFNILQHQASKASNFFLFTYYQLLIITNPYIYHQKLHPHSATLLVTSKLLLYWQDFFACGYPTNHDCFTVTVFYSFFPQNNWNDVLVIFIIHIIYTYVEA